MFVYPYMRELPDIFIEFFKSILKVGYEIPRLEYVMSQSEYKYWFCIIHGNRGFVFPSLQCIHSFFCLISFIEGDDEFGYLHIIEEAHVDMLKMYEEVRQFVQRNWYGPKIYLHPIYRYYFVLLARKMKLITEKIFTQRTIPDLPVSF